MSRPAKAFAAVLVTLAALILGRSVFLLRSGLYAHYFTTSDFSGPEARAALDPAISTGQLMSSWGYLPPDVFSVRWSGHLFVDAPGSYALTVTSDDGAELYLDGRLVVDNGGTHGAFTSRASAYLARGSHTVVLQYSQAGGAYQLEWMWGREGQPLGPVPGWLLSPTRRSYAALVAIRALGWLWSALIVAAFALAARLAYLGGYWPRRAAAGVDDDHRERAASGSRRRVATYAVLLVAFAGMTVVHTWPLATNPAHLSRNDAADTMLNEWTIAWIAHQLPRAPLRLFDGNMFYPEHGTVAYSENLVVQGVMAAPLLWLGASPVLAYNLVLMAGFTLTGWAMCLVVARWTGDWVAGIGSGIILAYCPHVLTRLPHLQAQHVEFLPLALLSFDALLRKPRWRSATWLAVWFVLQALASIYLMIFALVALAVAMLVRPEDWLGRPFRRLAPRLAWSAALSIAALLPFLLPYWRLHDLGFVRPLDEVVLYAASLRDYVTTPSRFLPFAGGAPALFPGGVALVLCAVALATGTAFADSRARMCLAFGMVGVLLSFGPAVAPGYEFLYASLPVLQGIRVSARFGYLGTVAVAVLAGYGMAWLRRRMAGRRPWRVSLSVGLLVLLCLEPLAAPIDYLPFDRTPSIYRIPAADPGAAVVEVPMAPPEAQFRDAEYLLDSTLNWKPLVNGYSGFTSDAHQALFATTRDFPDARAVAALRKIGVTYVFVHTDRIDQASIAAIGSEPHLHRVAADGPIVLYGLDRADASAVR